MTRTKHDLRHYQPFEPFTKEKPAQTNARDPDEFFRRLSAALFV